jgi:hypothetical protein
MSPKSTSNARNEQLKKRGSKEKEYLMINILYREKCKVKYKVVYKIAPHWCFLKPQMIFDQGNIRIFKKFLHSTYYENKETLHYVTSQ